MNQNAEEIRAAVNVVADEERRSLRRERSRQTGTLAFPGHHDRGGGIFFRGFGRLHGTATAFLFHGIHDLPGGHTVKPDHP